MLGLPVEKPEKNLFELDYVGIKASQFSFNRLQKADPVLGVDMASTGEVGCIGMDTSCAVLKAMLSVGYRIPQKNILLSTGTMKQKADMMDAARMLVNKGYKLLQRVVHTKRLQRMELKVLMSIGRVRRGIRKHWRCFIARKSIW